MMETTPTTPVPSVITPPPIDYTARVVTDVPAPVAQRLDHDQLFKSDGTVDLAVLQRHMYGEGKLYLEDVEEIINRCTEIMMQEPTLLAIDAPITGMHPPSAFSSFLLVTKIYINLTHQCMREHLSLKHNS